MLVCPLCHQGNMVQVGEYMVCQGDTNHAIHITKELDRYTGGEKTLSWLIARMKIRNGKKVHGR